MYKKKKKGKTTLLNRILKEKHGMKICVIENEFGDVGIDNLLIENNKSISTKEQIIEMLNGCICCTVRGDLINVIHKVLKENPNIEMILIETTGLADPAPIIQSFYTDPKLSARLKLDGVITVVDCINFTSHLEKDEQFENECIEQIAFADRILLNKVDLLEKTLQEKFEKENLPKNEFKDFFQKEINSLEEKIKSINNAVSIFTSSFSDVSLEKILSIGAFDLDKVVEMEPEFFYNFDHQHDDRVTSVCFSIDKEIEGEVLNEWFSSLVRNHGKDIFRAKGIFAIKGTNDKYAFQGVHMLIDMDAIGEWKEGETKNCKLVFIGRNLDKMDLKDSFYSLF